MSNQSTYWVIFELLWRDYFRYVASKYGNKIFHSGGKLLLVLILSEKRRYQNRRVILFFGLGFMALNATFNNISVIMWLLVLLVEETGVLEENHRPVASH